MRGTPPPDTPGNPRLSARRCSVPVCGFQCVRGFPGAVRPRGRGIPALKSPGPAQQRCENGDDVFSFKGKGSVFMDGRARFGSRLGFILVSAGCAIGLGNVWKFPYLCGRYGGGAFLVIYLVFLLILGLPILVCEFAVGRGSQKGIAAAFSRLAPARQSWGRTKWFCMAGNYLLMMFYTSVAGWMLYYGTLAARGAFQGASPGEITGMFSQMLARPGLMAGWTAAVCVGCFAVCAAGLQKGVEKVSKGMMACLLLVMAVLAVRCILLPGAGEGLRFYLVPDLDRLLEQGVGNVVFGAMSQSFFTLSVGVGSMTIFGSYLEKDRSLAGEAVNILALDTTVAFLAGLIILPSCFAYGVDPGSGPQLVLVTLPNIFAQMASGRLWGTLFFLFLSFAALTTVVAVFENILSFPMDLWGWSRRKSVAVNLALVTLLSMPCVLGFSVWSGFEPLGPGTNIMDLEDFLISSNILPLGSLLYLFFCTRKHGWGWDHFLAEANAGSGMKLPGQVRPLMAYVLPCLISFVYLKGYYDFFAPKGWGYLAVWMTIAALLLGLTLRTGLAPGKAAGDSSNA